MAALGDWDEVAAFAASLPGTVAGTYYGGPAIKSASSGRPVVTPSREPDSFCLHLDLDHKAMLLDVLPDRVWQTPHYAGWPAVLVRYGPDDGIGEWIGRALELAAARPRARAR
ncbi:hypothetical protein OMW55_02310 [Sphingomonas sp. BN140010]|uniref:MmcQ/YjbR family DNA-binding protein n=1 Tax=Sphingomonas arvum TaxID=2992113 RepID=A0ABT3JC40_9SPHN|nr:hypothetical protein [Sphingomonas sp. BN140010]MCW3796643.1 hypothetical protein [Sphingomonas sp. BN140010]